MSATLHYLIMALLTAGLILFVIRTLRISVGRTGVVRILIALGVFAAFSMGIVFAMSLSGKGVFAQTIGILLTSTVLSFALVGAQYAGLSTGRRLLKNTRESWKTDTIIALVSSAIIFILSHAVITRIMQ